MSKVVPWYIVYSLIYSFGIAGIVWMNKSNGSVVAGFIFFGLTHVVLWSYWYSKGILKDDYIGINNGLVYVRHSGRAYVLEQSEIAGIRGYMQNPFSFQLVMNNDVRVILPPQTAKFEPAFKWFLENIPEASRYM
ncbi:MAG: hypothetical protein GC165_04830 [Armatimonadetes bacterium]|nr:hypothetical protein [Armatimonadota bacterium]